MPVYSISRTSQYDQSSIISIVLSKILRLSTKRRYMLTTDAERVYPILARK